MATLASPHSASPPPLKRRTKSCARKCERYCCNILTYFPLAFVYGLTTWAVWVEAGIGFRPSTKGAWAGLTTSFVGVFLYLLLNWCYTVAVFTDPGSPLNSRAGYSHLPITEESGEYTSFTVSSSGNARFCKKCQCRKPDRTHHCSTCKRCVLKMDHHCPWLATCLGLHNYKPFVLFLSYTSLFCWVCFWVTGEWCWSEILNSGQYVESLMPINYVLLCVISGIIGLVLTGFTAWHLSLSARGMTTIECLEKTRYLSPIRKSMQRHNFSASDPNASTLQSYGQQFLEIHANTLPGVTRVEEGEERPSPVASISAPPQDFDQEQPNHQSYANRERARERDAYNDYLDEQDSQSLPNAFDLGWRRNLTHLFGPTPLHWFLPVCNTTGDGWRWEASPKWLQARDRLQRVREDRAARQHEEDPARQFPFQPRTSSRPMSGVSMSTLPPRDERNVASSNDGYEYEEDEYDVSSDEADAERRHLVQRPHDDRGAGWGRRKVVGGERKER